jgi:RNA polymerase sigma factor (sigma-70 family)
VQDILFAVHLKRHTWDPNAPFAPWLFAIARNKLIDALRRRGRWIFVNIDDFSETIASEPVEETIPPSEIAVHLDGLPKRQRDVLQLIAVENMSIKAVATKLRMTDGAVRVSLHRGLANLAAKLRKDWDMDTDQPAAAGAYAGLLSAGFAATLYASQCIDDSPLFVATWYPLAIGLVAAVGALAGSRCLRFWTDGFGGRLQSVPQKTAHCIWHRNTCCAAVSSSASRSRKSAVRDLQISAHIV